MRAAAAVRGLVVEQSSCGAGAARDLSRPLCDLPLSSPEENHWAAFDCFGRERSCSDLDLFLRKPITHNLALVLLVIYFRIR